MPPVCPPFSASANKCVQPTSRQKGDLTMNSQDARNEPNEEQQAEDYLKLLGNCIRQRRLKLGLSQELLAKAARISRTEQQYIEGASRRPKVDTLLRCCQGLGISLIELLAEVDRRQMERLRDRRP